MVTATSSSFTSVLLLVAPSLPWLAGLRLDAAISNWNSGVTLATATVTDGREGRQASRVRS
jgi:hypothetical protein